MNYTFVFFWDDLKNMLPDVTDGKLFQITASIDPDNNNVMMAQGKTVSLDLEGNVKMLNPDPPGTGACPSPPAGCRSGGSISPNV